MLHYLGIDPPAKPDDPGRAALMGRSAEDLGALVYSFLAELAVAEAELVAPWSNRSANFCRIEAGRRRRSVAYFID